MSSCSDADWMLWTVVIILIVVAFAANLVDKFAVTDSQKGGIYHG